MNEIITYLENVYGMKVAPCGIPKNEFQRLKRNFYIWIKSVFGDKLFFFLRDRVSPIKFLEQRPDGSVWFLRRNESGKINYELCLMPVPIEACIYCPGHNNQLLDITAGNNYRAQLYFGDDNSIDFVVNYHNSQKIIDAYFTKVPKFKEDLRNYKLSKL